MSFFQELRGRPLDAFGKTEMKLLAKGTAQLGLARQDLIVRPLMASDLQAALNSFNFSITATSGLTTLINNQTITDNRFVSINGICYPETTPLIDWVRITRSGSVARLWPIEHIPAQDDNTMWVDDPITVDQNTTITIEGYNDTTATNATENLIFIGLVVEKRGMILNP